MPQYYLGVDLGGTNLRCAVIDENNTLIMRTECPTLAHEGSGKVIARLAENMLECASRAGIPANNIAAACVGVPGPIHQKTGVVHSAPNMLDWSMVPLANILTQRTGITTFIENDANCAGWGEYASGAGKGCEHMLLATIGTGVGGAIILNGKLHTGRDGTAGELGHVCIVDGGLPCGCGARGCVEAYASAPAVVRRFTRLLDDGWHSPLAARRGSLTCQDVFKAAEDGDAVALRIVEETGRYLGVMASVLAELLNPDRCIVAGGMALAGENLFSAMRNTCLNRNKHPGRTMEILPAALGQNAGLVGAAGQAKIRLDEKNSPMTGKTAEQ